MAAALGDFAGMALHHSFSILLASLRGDAADLPGDWQDVMSTAPPLPVVRALTAMAWMLSGETDRAAGLYATLVPLPEGPLDPPHLAALGMVAALAVTFEDVETCRALREAFKTAEHNIRVWGAGTVVYAGSVQRLVADLSLAYGDVPAAVEAFEAGLVVDTGLGARPCVVQGRLGLATALGERGGRGDLDRAGPLARAAAAEARRLDMPGPLAAADALLRRLEATARTADGLTPREREVADLVAQALSNRDIAGRLVLSERTVESHVRSILAKTGTTTRTELARRVLQARRSG